MTHSFAKYQEKINASEQILVIYGSGAAFPAVAVATSIYLWLRALDKKVAIVSPVSPVVEFSHLVGINKVRQRLIGENLVIRLPFAASNIDKVVSDLNADKDQLSLIVKPKKGSAALQLDHLDFAYQAPEYDLIFYIDVRDEADLSALVGESHEFWQNSTHNITLNDYANPSPIPADISEVLGKDVGFAAFWAGLLRHNDVAIDADQASNLLMALDQETHGFASQNSSVESFELAAWLMRQGGTRYVPDEQAINDFRPENHLPQIIDFQAPKKK